MHDPMSFSSPTDWCLLCAGSTCMASILFPGRLRMQEEGAQSLVFWKHHLWLAYRLDVTYKLIHYTEVQISYT